MSSRRATRSTSGPPTRTRGPTRRTGRPGRSGWRSAAPDVWRGGVRIVIAFGGNALIREDERGTWGEQTAHAIEAARAIARVARAHQVILTHGNGPQVGALALQQSSGEPDAPALPFDVLDAM